MVHAPCALHENDGHAHLALVVDSMMYAGNTAVNAQCGMQSVRCDGIMNVGTHCHRALACRV
eukprot:8997407-Lingulodinium_polyedra.AAC.1